MTDVLTIAKIAVQNIIKRKKRAALTMLGIFIGIAAVVALVSLGQGLQQTINAQFEKVGADKIFVEIQKFDVGTIPYRRNHFNSYVYPNKLIQYLKHTNNSGGPSSASSADCSAPILAKSHTNTRRSAPLDANNDSWNGDHCI